MTESLLCICSIKAPERELFTFLLNRFSEECMVLLISGHFVRII